LIKAGIRYDINRIAFSPPNDGNFAPRVGFSYQPGFLPKLNVRASYGLFFALQPIGPAAGAALSSSGRLRLPATVFPFSVIPLTLPDRRFPEGDNVPPLLSAISVPQLELGLGIQKDLRNTYAQEGNFGLDYFLTPGTTISATYNVVRGTKILGVRNINPIANPVFGNPLANAMFGRPDPTRGDFFEFESAFDSYFHGATFTFNSRLNRRFNVLASFTVAKAIDNFIDLRIESGLSESNDPLNPRGERGLSVQDVRKRLVVSGTWDLDYTKNIFLRDFQISSIINLSDGRPFNLIAGVDLNQNGDNPPGDRPAGLGRNVGIGPGFANVDFRVTRRFVVKENIQFSAFAEFFNLFNRVNISDFNRVFLPNAQGGFNLPQQDNGRFTVSNDRFRNAFSPRQIQFGFRFSF
jgi:hypothetical protein